MAFIIKKWILSAQIAFVRRMSEDMTALPTPPSAQIVPSSPDSLVANSHILGVLRAKARLESNERRPFHALNSTTQSDPANMTAQELRNASPATNDLLPGITNKDRFVSQQAPVSMRVNSESVSNEIDGSNSQYEKQHSEHRIWT
jgi:hypothetical protein